MAKHGGTTTPICFIFFTDGLFVLFVPDLLLIGGATVGKLTQLSCALNFVFCDFKQSYTQYGGVRPFGTAMLIGGIDSSGPHLYETDPSGALMAYKAGGIGAGRNEVMEVFEKDYKDNMSQNQAINLGLKGLSAANENNLKADVIEIAVVNASKGFHTLDSKSVGEAVKKIK